MNENDGAPVFRIFLTESGEWPNGGRKWSYVVEFPDGNFVAADVPGDTEREALHCIGDDLEQLTT